MTKKKGSPPDYRLKILNKSNDQKCNDAGAGWINPNGSISVILAPGINLVSNPDYVFTLFPIEENQ